VADCESLPRCVFFNNKMSNMPASAELLKQQYCKNRFSTCARYLVMKSLGPEAVPADLFPGQKEMAEEIIRQAHKG
jgi:hypothetical protein